MYCRNCGKELAEDANFCSFCGCNVLEAAPTSTNSGAEVVWKVFARISRITGIVSIPLAIYTFGIIGIEGFVLGVIASRAKDEKVKSEARAGIVLNTIAMVLGIIFAIFLVLYIVGSD